MAGKGKIAISALESVKKAMAKAKPELVPASQALATHEGKVLKPLQYDRMRVNLDTGELGGGEYSGLSLYNPPHAKAGVVAAVSNKGALTRLINQYKDYGLNEVIHTPMVGSDIQHRGNPTMFGKFYKEFTDKVKSGEVTQDQINLVNDYLNSKTVVKNKKRVPLFKEPVDVASEEFVTRPLSFEQRTEFADVMSGKGIGGPTKGQIIDVTTRLGETIDPYVADAPVSAFGHRLVELGTNTLYDPTLHGDYPYHIIGKDLGVRFKPIEKEYMTDFAKQILEDPKKARLPTDMDLRTGNVSQRITPEWLQILKDAGNKDGGSIHADGSARLANGASARKMVQYILKDQNFGAGGKAIKKGIKVLEDVAEKVMLPPAENSARTQIVGTMPTYEKARDILGKEGIKGADIIDFGAGKGLGSTAMKADSFEPYPQGWYPTYTKSEDIPSEKYKGLLNLNVLNVLDPEMRAHTVKEIGRVMQPEGGTGLITTRGRDVLNTVGGKAGNEPMSVITSRDTYQKGFEPEELREYIRYILGGDFEYEPLNLGQAGVKIKKKADGGSVEDDTRYITQDPTAYLLEEVKPVNTRLDAKEFKKRIGSGNLFGRITGDIVGGVKDIAEDTAQEVRRLKPRSIIDIPVNATAEAVGFPMDIAEELNDRVSPIRSDIIAPKNKYLMPIKPLPLTSESLKQGAKDLGITSGEQFPNLQFASQFALPSLGRLGVKGAKAYGNLVKEGIERNIEKFEPRMNIIKDPGGMLIGGEKALDNELLYMKKTENAYPHAQANFVTDQKDTEAQALNNWIDTKVRKYLRNQAGSKDDPILKAIESGVEHNFQPPMGDLKYNTKYKRRLFGKPEEGIAQTELGKEFEYKIDSMFDPKKSKDIKEVLNDPMEHADASSINRRKASILRVEQNLPIQDEADFEALKLINQIPDEHVYTLSGTNITERLGLNHVSDVLYEDLRSGKLRPEQLNQMSIEKAIRRTAEYDAEKAKAMNKANASSVEGMPIPKAYDDGYKWVELKHDTDPKKTQVALKSEGEMMGHCVGGYCPEVESGEIKIYSLRGPDGKSHVTIEARPQFSMTLWRNANLDAINSNPKLKQYDFNMNSLDNDHKYGYRMTERDYVREMTKEMKKLGINPVEPPSYLELHQVKGKQNKRPDDKYQSYISDFVKNNPTKHEIVSVEELQNTNLMNVQDVVDDGIVSKTLHNNPEIDKILKIKHAGEYRPDMPNIPKSFSRAEELRYDLFKEAATDLARQNKSFIDKDDILNHLREKYLLPKKKSGGSINLNQEYKLENMRRRYG
jgi:hypothetical protein